MPPKHSTGGRSFGKKADGNGGNNAIFPVTAARPGPSVWPSRGVPPTDWPSGVVGRCPPACTYGISMLRILLMIAGAIVIVFVAAEVIHTLFWLALIALVIAFIGMSFGVFRAGRRSKRRPRRHY
jgi:hypothetical protein